MRRFAAVSKDGPKHWQVIDRIFNQVVIEDMQVSSAKGWSEQMNQADLAGKPIITPEGITLPASPPKRLKTIGGTVGRSHKRAITRELTQE